MRKTPTTATTTRRGLVAPTVAVFASAALLAAFWDNWPSLIGVVGLFFAAPHLHEAVKERMRPVVYEWLTGQTAKIGTAELLSFFAILALAFICLAWVLPGEGRYVRIASTVFGLFVLSLAVEYLRGEGTSPRS